MKSKATARIAGAVRTDGWMILFSPVDMWRKPVKQGQERREANWWALA